MRLSFILLLILIGLMMVSCDAESITQPGNADNGDKATSISVFGGSNIDEGQSIIHTSDGGFLITGTSSSNDGDFSGLNLGNRDVFALKLNSSGNLQWLRNFGGSNSDWAMDVIEDSGGNFVMTGYTRSNDGDFAGLNRGENDIFLIKIAPNGNLIWARTYGGSGEDLGYGLTEGPNGGYILTGSTRSTDQIFSGRSSTSKDVFVLFTDFNGQPAWIETFGGTGNDEGLDIVIGQNNRIVVTGSFESSDGSFSGAQPGGTSFFTIETQLNGSLIGITTYGGGGSDIGNKIISTLDGGYAIAGRSDSDSGHFSGLNRGGQDAFIMKLDSGRNINWINTFGGSGYDEAHSLIQTPGGDYLIAGESGSNDQNLKDLNRGGLDAFMIHVNPDGTFKRAKTYGGSNTESAKSFIQLPNGNLAFTGWTESSDGDFSGEPIDSKSIFFFLTDPDGKIQ
ncbi:MAG: hypothetical protein EA390_09705 [Balneolaceae bacterium]|nr:MAG: hypothetical protein EA390_09705 [Balneolaceae bacterium]